jgi:hypothetical protein
MAAPETTSTGPAREVGLRTYRRLAASTPATLATWTGIGVATIALTASVGVVALGGLSLFVVGGAASLFGGKKRSLDVAVPGTLQREGDALVFQPRAANRAHERMSVPLERLEVGYAVPLGAAGDGARIWLRSRTSEAAELGFDCASTEEAEALLVDAGLDEARRVLDVSGVRIGVDGVWHRGRLAAYARLDRVEVLRRKVLLIGNDGRVMALPIAGAEAALLCETVAARVRSAMKRARAEDEPAPQLRRDGRAIAAWRAALGVRVDDYRARELDPPAMERALRGLGTPPDARIGAALALLAALPERAASVLPEVARACASSPLSELLASLAREHVGDLMIEHALDRLAEAERDAFEAGAR